MLHSAAALGLREIILLGEAAVRLELFILKQAVWIFGADSPKY